ncbi:MAG TPA: GGDEF domain-containing protein [Planctomycetota bacterium]|jgi:diguanylate cyclase (GGDEF)-like protein|nr:GGDEF domain-containing protein [Planctomycetota bacterium]
MSFFKELQALEDQGIDLIEVLGQDRHLESPEALVKIISQLGREGESLYSELLYYLTYRRFDAEQAETLWRAIMKHKARMGEALARKVTFRVAALDYLSSRSGILRQVRLIAKPEFESFLSYVNVDEVTGVFNRRYFNDVLAHEVRRARRYSSELSLLVLDLDDFKRVNDVGGHVEGDATLRRVGRLLRETTRQTDSVCRYGGDEFAVVLPETGNAEAFTLAERIRKTAMKVSIVACPELQKWPAQAAAAAGGASAEPYRSSTESAANGGAALTLSVGGATYPGDCDEAEELVALADQLCLDAKRRGKNQVRMSAAGGAFPAAGE